ncbi:hypothetical protein ACQZV8_01110 [Magnetococcales bacterium HHB-1]
MTNDYMAYVGAVYLIALFSYGGIALHWLLQRKKLKKQVENLEEGLKDG